MVKQAEIVKQYVGKDVFSKARKTLVSILQPYDEGVFYGIQNITRINVVSDI